MKSLCPNKQLQLYQIFSNMFAHYMVIAAWQLISKFVRRNHFPFITLTVTTGRLRNQYIATSLAISAPPHPYTELYKEKAWPYKNLLMLANPKRLFHNKFKGTSLHFPNSKLEIHMIFYLVIHIFSCIFGTKCPTAHYLKHALIWTSQYTYTCQLLLQYAVVKGQRI